MGRALQGSIGGEDKKTTPYLEIHCNYYCHELKLVIEIDGRIHLRKEEREYDIGREVTLNEFGIEIIRFTNNQIINNAENVVETIKSKIEELKGKRIENTIGELELDKSL